jgi:hypothetical protein
MVFVDMAIITEFKYSIAKIGSRGRCFFLSEWHFTLCNNNGQLLVTTSVVRFKVASGRM